MTTLPAADSDGGGGGATALSDDVLTEILVRLPAKSVIRFKSVCKHWLSLSSGDLFRRLHTLRRHKPQPSLLLRTRIPQFIYFNPITKGEKSVVPYTFPLPNPKILNSCNGLMLLRCDDINLETDYYVYNPATKQSRKFVINHDCEFPKLMGLILAFDPSKSLHYKIVCVRGSRISSANDRNRSYRIEVYDSESHNWKLCLEKFTDAIDTNFSCGVQWNNSIYWKTNGNIIYYDVDKHVMGSLPRNHPEIPWCPWPDRSTKGHCFSQLQESNGHLYHFVVDGEGKSLALWELQEIDDGFWWCLKYYDPPPMWWKPRKGHLSQSYCDQIDGDFGGRSDREYSTSVLRLIGGSDGEEATSSFVTYRPGKIGAYKFGDGSFEELVDLTNLPFYRENSLQFDFQGVHQFGESLAPV